MDSRGEVILAALHSPPSLTWSKKRGSQVTYEEDEESVCVHSSTEDLGRKVSYLPPNKTFNHYEHNKTSHKHTVIHIEYKHGDVPSCCSDCVFMSSNLSLQWRISRVVEPSASLAKDKSFSIAAALPMPCYGSLVNELSTVCLQSEERLPLSQNECSAQHLAQQLTLMQQVHTDRTASALLSSCCCLSPTPEGNISLVTP